MKKAKDRDCFSPSTSKNRATTGKSQPKITEHFRSDSKRKYSKQHPKQRHITQLLLKSVTCASLPLSIVDKPSFRKHIEELNENYAIPNWQTIKETHLPFTEKLIVNSVTTEMKDLTSAVVVNLFCAWATLAPWRALPGRTNATSDRLTLCLKITHFVLSIQRYILLICTEPRYILLICI